MMSKRITRAQRVMTKSRFLMGFIVSLTASIPSATHALASDKHAPIEVSSETAEFDDKTGIAKHTGKVLMIQGSRRLQADVLLIKRNAQQKIISLTAIGNPARFETQLEPDKPILQAKAERLEFYPQKQKIALIRQAEVTQEGHEILGEHLIYHLDTRILSSLFTQGGRTTVLIPTTEAF